MEHILLLSCEFLDGSLVTTEKEMKTIFHYRVVLYLTTLEMSMLW